MTKDISKPANWAFETKQIHVGQESPDPSTRSQAVPIYQTTAYVFENAAHAASLFDLTGQGNIYGRLTNSTQDILEKRIAALEGGVSALALASGAAAMTYVFNALAHSGDHIVAEKTIYGGTQNLLANTLPLSGVTASFAGGDPSDFERAIRPETKAIFIETLGNPNSNIVDCEAVADIAHRHGIPLVVDSTFTPPNIFRPIEHGADIVIHSMTKFIGGHGAGLGGVIVDSGRFDWTASGKFPHLSEPNPSYHGVCFTESIGADAFVKYIRLVLLRDMGAAIAPFNAFLFLLSLETLSLRVERQVENSLKIVEWLAAQPRVLRVNHPALPGHPDHLLYQKYFPRGAGSIFTIDITGGQKEAFEFIDNLKIFSNVANVADVKSLVIHPATTTHGQLSAAGMEEQSIYPSTIRLSIGAENVDDLIADLDQALNR